MLLEEETKYIMVILVARNFCSWLLDLITHVSSSKRFISWSGLIVLESDWQQRRKRAWDKNMIQLFLVIRWHCDRVRCLRAWLVISDTHEGEASSQLQEHFWLSLSKLQSSRWELRGYKTAFKDLSKHLYDRTGDRTILVLQFPLLMEPNTPIWQQICGHILICPHDFKRNNAMC